MKWHECNEVRELKAIASFREVKKIISSDLGGKIKITAKGWNDLHKKIMLLKNIFINYNNDETSFDGFVSESQKYLFCLTKMDGKNRQNNLGVNALHYKDKELAKKWRRHIAQKIHPDKCSDPRVKEAMNVLENMYSEMIR